MAVRIKGTTCAIFQGFLASQGNGPSERAIAHRTRMVGGVADGKNHADGVHKSLKAMKALSMIDQPQSPRLKALAGLRRAGSFAPVFFALALGACVSEQAATAAKSVVAPKSTDSSLTDAVPADPWNSRTDNALLARTCASWVFDGVASSELTKHGYEPKFAPKGTMFAKSYRARFQALREIRIERSTSRGRRVCSFHITANWAPDDSPLNSGAMNALAAEIMRRGFKPALVPVVYGADPMFTGQFVKEGKTISLTGTGHYRELETGRLTFTIREDN